MMNDRGPESQTLHYTYLSLVQALLSDAHMSSKKLLLSIRAEPSEFADQNDPTRRMYS